MKAFAFSENALKRAQHKLAGVKYLVLGVALLSVAFSVPSEGDTLSKTAKTFLAAVLGYSLVIAACFVIAKALGSKKHFKEYAGVSSLAGGLGALIALAGVGIALLANSLFKSEAFAGLASSVIPFYSFALFGWASETAADLKEAKGIALGIVSTALFVLLSVLLPTFAGG